MGDCFLIANLLDVYDLVPRLDAYLRNAAEILAGSGDPREFSTTHLERVCSRAGS